MDLLQARLSVDLRCRDNKVKLRRAGGDSRKDKTIGLQADGPPMAQPVLGLGLRPPCSSGLRSSCLNRTFPFRSGGREGSESAHSSIRVVIDFPAMPRRWTCGYVRPEAKGLTAAILEEPIVSLNQAPK